MKKSKIRLLSVLAVSLVAIFAVVCLVGFSACDMFTSSSSSNDDDDHVHIVTSWDLEEATCEEDGSQLGTCDICGDSVMLIIPATGHSWDEGTVTKEATCGDGEMTYTCTVCGATETEVIEGTGDHSWDEGTVTKEATEDEEGEITYTCEVCGATKTEPIAKLESSGDQGGDTGDTGDTGDEGDVEEGRVSATDPEKNASDLAAGNNLSFEAADITVTYDPETKMYTISGTSNVFGEDLANAFWGTTNGLAHAECEYITFTISANAGETIKITTYNGDEVEKVRAMYGEGVDKTANGLTDDNGDPIKEASDGTWIVDVTDHTTGDWKMELEVTYANGDAVVYTIVLGKIERAHQNAENARVDAPKEGDEDFSATVKGENDEQVTVTFTDCEIDVSYDSSTRTYTIEGTSAKYSEEQLEALQLDGDGAHTDCWYVSFKVTANAGETITIKTYNGDTSEKTWTLCGEGVEGSSNTDGAFILDTTDHTPGEWRMVLEVEYANGDKVTYTIVLGTVQTYCEANGHTWDEGVVTTAPTCTQDGVLTKTCEVCGDTMTESIPALGHDYEEELVWSAQSSGAGYEVSASIIDVCTRCGEEKTVDASSTTVTKNEDGTYTAKVQASDGEEYEDTSRVFVDAGDGEDGTIVDIGMGTEYTPVYDEENESTLVSYKLTSVPKDEDSTYVVVAGYIDGVPVSVDGYLSCHINDQNKVVSTDEDKNHIETLIFEDGVTDIGDYAFYYCTSLKTVVFCDTITEIGQCAFQTCSNLTGSIEFGKSLTKIGYDAFASCSGLTSVSFSDGLVSIGESAFQSCSGLTGRLEFPSSVTSIGSSAFQSCNNTNLTSIVIHGNEGVTTIGSSAFKSCSHIETLIFDGGTYEIGGSAFATFNALTTMIIVNGVTFTSVGSSGFQAVDSGHVVTAVYYDGAEDEWAAMKTLINGYHIVDDADVYYYSETEPEKSDDSDTLYWHWGDDGTPVAWDV